MQNIDKNSLIITNIFDTNKLVLRKYKNGESKHFRGHPSVNEKHLEREDKSFEKKRGMINREVFDFPLSRKISLQDINNKTIEVIVTSDKNFELFELLENFHCGYRLNDRERKYLNLYIVYEALSNNYNIELKAIRNSFAHSRDNLNQKQTVDALINMFGDIKIDLNKYKHKKVFNEKYRELLCYGCFLLIEEILKKITKKPNFLNTYYII